MSIKTSELTDCSENYIIKFDELVLIKDKDNLSNVDKKIAYFKGKYSLITDFEKTYNNTMETLCRTKTNINQYVERHDKLLPMETIQFFKEWIDKKFKELEEKELIIKKLIQQEIDLENYFLNKMKEIEKNLKLYKFADKPTILKNIPYKGGVSGFDWKMDKYSRIYIDIDKKNISENSVIITKIRGDNLEIIESGVTSVYKPKGDYFRVYVYASDYNCENLLKISKKSNWQVSWFSL